MQFGQRIKKYDLQEDPDMSAMRIWILILAFTDLQGLEILMLKNPTSASGVKVLFNHRTFLAYPWGPSQVAVVSLAAATRRWT